MRRHPSRLFALHLHLLLPHHRHHDQGLLLLLLLALGGLPLLTALLLLTLPLAPVRAGLDFVPAPLPPAGMYAQPHTKRRMSACACRSEACMGGWQLPHERMWYVRYVCCAAATTYALRHVKGRLHTTQVFVGRLALRTPRGIARPRDVNGAEGAGLYTGMWQEERLCVFGGEGGGRCSCYWGSWYAAGHGFETSLRHHSNGRRPVSPGACHESSASGKDAMSHTFFSVYDCNPPPPYPHGRLLPLKRTERASSTPEHFQSPLRKSPHTQLPRCTAPTLLHSSAAAGHSSLDHCRAADNMLARRAGGCLQGHAQHRAVASRAAGSAS